MTAHPEISSEPSESNILSSDTFDIDRFRESALYSFRDLLHTESQYVDIDELKNVCHVNDITCIKTLHINIQGINSKFDKFKMMLESFEQVNVYFHFILLCETFVRDTNAYMFDIPGYTFVYKNRCKIQRGGVGIYIRTGIRY